VGGVDEVEPPNWERITANLERGSKRRCVNCSHNSLEHFTEARDLPKKPYDQDKEAWNDFWFAPAPCIHCGCDEPESETEFWRWHRNCPNACECKDFTE
jgi:hypothetical protein